MRLHYFGSLCSYISEFPKIYSFRYARLGCKIKPVVCTPYPPVTAGTQKNWKIMNSHVNPHHAAFPAWLNRIYHHMVYIGGIVQSVSALWTIHSTIYRHPENPFLAFLTFSGFSACSVAFVFATQAAQDAAHTVFEPCYMPFASNTWQPERRLQTMVEAFMDR